MRGAVCWCSALAEPALRQYFQVIRRLFDKRKLVLDPALDARLSFTAAMGYYPRGVSVPAWKAVFVNSKTDKKVFARLIRSIEDL